MRNYLNHILLYLSVIAVFGCVQAPKPVFAPAPVAPKNAVTVMTYNVENLFDTQDDPLKKDEAYLPLAKKTEAVKAACRVANNQDWRREECITKDWNDSILAMKLKRLTDVVRQVNEGRGPDVMILQEVENRFVLEKWRKEYLADLNYKPALLVEGPDERGIDVGIITRLESTNPLNLHTIPFKENENLKATDISATRGILEATLKLNDGTLLTVLGVHLPSQGNPTEMRKQSLDFINNIRASLPADRLIVVGGDFNISSDEEVRTGLLKKNMAKNWAVSHMVGCQDCAGTYFYSKDQSWSFFDVFLMSPSLVSGDKSGWQLMPNSVRIENKSNYQVGKNGGPARFNEERKGGVSDHYPLVFDIIKR